MRRWELNVIPRTRLEAWLWGKWRRRQFTPKVPGTNRSI